MITLSPLDKKLATLAALLGLLTVAGGAFGAHGLKGQVPDVDLEAFETGMRYGLIHALAMLAALGFGCRRAAIGFLVGVILFTGSLAVLGLTGSRSLVLITPVGGLAFLSGWALLIWHFLKD